MDSIKEKYPSLSDHMNITSIEFGENKVSDTPLQNTETVAIFVYYDRSGIASVECTTLLRNVTRGFIIITISIKLLFRRDSKQGDFTKQPFIPMLITSEKAELIYMLHCYGVVTNR